jgi:hypothetical protein
MATKVKLAPDGEPEGDGDETRSGYVCVEMSQGGQREVERLAANLVDLFGPYPSETARKHAALAVDATLREGITAVLNIAIADVAAAGQRRAAEEPTRT